MAADTPSPLLTRRWRAGPQADLSRLPLVLDLGAISRAEGVRAALAIALIGLLGEFVSIPLLPEASLGALLTCLCDTAGPVRRRIPALLAFALLGAAITAGFGLLHPYGLPVTVFAATAAIFTLSFARVWGPVTMQAGNILVVVAILALDRAETPRAALLLGTLFGAGALYAVLLTLVIWRVHPYRPARRALSEVFRRLAALVADLVPFLDGTPLGTSDPTAWEDHARAHRRHVRDGIEAANTLVLDTVRIRGSASLRANQSLIQLEAADQLFGVVIAISDVLEATTPEARAAAASAVSALRLLLAVLSDETARDQPETDPAVHAINARLLGAVAKLDAIPALAALSEPLLSRLRIALLLTTPEGLVPGRDGLDRPSQRWHERVIAPLRANCRWSSPNLRHAIRATLVAGPALAVTLSLGDPHAHWLIITLVLTLQPFFATTWQRALERSAGTVLGGVAAALIATLVHGPLATALVMAPIAVVAFAVRGVNFGLFMACYTPMIVLFTELGQHGDEVAIAVARAAYTVLGGLLAVAAGVLLWPSWEQVRVRDALADALRTHAAYADLELASLQAGGPQPGLDTARRTAGIASNTLEAALNRAMQEPRGAERAQATATPTVTTAAALVVDAALRRFAARLLSLQHDPAQAGTDPATLATWRTWLARSFDALQANAPLDHDPPSEYDHPALGRIARQVELMAGTLAPKPSRPTPSTSTPHPSTPSAAAAP